MSRHYGDIAFPPAVAAEQVRNGRRPAGAVAVPPPRSGVRPDRLTEDERAFLRERDGFYLASVGETGWPYVQYRGGPVGLLRVLGDSTLAWADFDGNLQYISTGNVSVDDRVALLVMDYPGQRRLKVFGRAQVHDAQDVPGLAEAVSDAGYPGTVERVVTVAVRAYDWNCPRHIVQRFNAAELEPRVLRLVAELQSLREQNEQLRTRLAELER
jgi:predicted pyridoxine 5'-phosphate oxidase superfamily flavin-nucleotide-binding protein